MHLVESREAEEALNDACARYLNAQAAWDDLTWGILLDRTLGTSITMDGRTRLIRDEGFKSIDRPTIEILYRDCFSYVEIIRVRFFTASASTAGSA